MKLPLFLLFLFLGGLFLWGASQPSIWGPFFYPLQYQESVKTHALANRLDPNLVAAMIYEESRFYAGQQSAAGARGLMQLVPSTAAFVARSLGDTDYTDQTLLEPDRNIRYGTFYFRYLLNKYEENTETALAAYNAGETNVDRWQVEGLREIPFRETREFVGRVGRTKKMYDTIYGTWYQVDDEPRD